MRSRTKCLVPGLRWSEHEIGVAVLSFELDTNPRQLEPPTVCAKGPPLTPAQHRVAALAVRGRTNGQIAAELNIELRTVANHMAAILTKTGAVSRVDLARRFRG